MRLPSLSDYSTAVQVPSACFLDEELRTGTVQKSPIGLPRAISGGFAITYQVTTGRSVWAVRCFHREASDLEAKYAAVSRYLERAPSGYFQSFEYQRQGIRMPSGGPFPIVKMAWIEGQTLGSFLEAHRRDSRQVSALAEQFKHLVEYLGAQQVAHGDLQHGNLMVAAGQLKLIDYDGMYVPGIPVERGDEIGHVNYQHPQRDASCFGPAMDRFSSIAIYLALLALSRQPDLWDRYNNGDNLLFTAKDYLDPEASAVLREVGADPVMAPLVERFRTLCRAPVASLPTLDGYLAGQLPTFSRPYVPTALVRTRQHRLLGAGDRSKILDAEGEIVEIFGKVSAFRRDLTRYRTPYVFLNFGDYRQGCFTVVIWSDILNQFTAEPTETLYGDQWVAVRGLVEKYARRGRPPQPQVVLTSPSDLRLLTEAEVSALQLELANSPEPTAGIGSAPPGSTRASRPTPASPRTRNQAILAELGRNGATPASPGFSGGTPRAPANRPAPRTPLRSQTAPKPPPAPARPGAAPAGSPQPSGGLSGFLRKLFDSLRGG